MLRPCTAVVIVGVFLTASIASASATTDAKQHYRAGMTAFNLEDYETAIRESEAASRTNPAPSFLFTLGQSQRMAGRIDKPIAFYRHYLATAGNAPNRAEVEATVAALQRDREAR